MNTKLLSTMPTNAISPDTTALSTQPSPDFLRIETWLTVLISTYKSHPSCGLAQTISFYLTSLLRHDDICFCGDKRCDYLAMQRYWHWYAMKDTTASTR